MADIGTSYLQIVPSMQGAVKNIQSTLSGIDLGGASKKMGASLSAALPSSLSKSVSKAMDNAATAAKKPLEAALKGVTSAEEGLAKAQNSRQKIVDQIAKSEQKLSDLSAAGKENTKAYAQTQSRLADQQNRLAKASFDVAGAQINLESAQANVAKVSGEVDAAIARQQSGWGKLAIQAPVVADAFKATGNALQTVGGHLTTVGGKLTKSITVPAVGAATAVGGLVAGLGFKRLVGIDTARAQFKGLGYDADAVMKQVDLGVTNTSLSMAEGASAAVSILATGAVPLEGLEAQIKRVANVSAAYGVDANHANYLLNNVLTKQKVTWGDLSQMQQNQIPIVTALADTFGYTGEQIQEMASNGEISIDMLNEALDNKAGAAAEEYAKSWQGVTKNILSNLGKLGAAFMEPSFEIVKDKAADLLAYLKTPEFSAAAASIGQQIAAGLSQAIDVVQGLIDKWNDLDPATQKLIGKLALVAVAAGPVLTVFGRLTSVAGGVMSGVGGIVDAVGKVAPKFAAAGGGAGGFLQVITKFAGPIGIAVAAIAALWATSEEFREGVMSVGQTLMEVGQQIWDALQPAIEQITSALLPILQQIGTVIGDLLVTISPILAQIGELIAGVIEALMPVIETILDFLVPALENAVTVIQAVFEAIVPIIQAAVDVISSIVDAWIAIFSGDWGAAWQAIQDAFSAVWELLGSIVQGAVDIISTVISGFLDTVSGVWNTAWDAVSGFLSDTWESIKSNVSTAIDNVRATIDTVMGTIRGAWSTAWTSVKTKFTDIWDGIKRGAKDGVDKVYDTVTGVKDKITGFFSGAGSWLKESGRKIIQGLVDGISGMVQNVKDAVGDVLSAARNLLPFSPAKEGPFSGRGWTLYSGQSIVEALAQGVTQKSSLFEGAVEDLMAGGSAALGSGSLGSAYVRGLPAGVGGTAASAGGTTIYDNSTIINPVAEPTSTSKRKQLQKVGANVGGLGG